jgi:hypothetical protein
MGYVILLLIQMKFLGIVLLHKVSSVLLYACHCSKQDFWSIQHPHQCAIPCQAHVHSPSPISVPALATMCNICVGAK